MRLAPNSRDDEKRSGFDMRTFELRLASRHGLPENTVTDLEVRVLVDGQWEPLDLHLQTRGFLIFVYSVFICQHMYLHRNAGERNLVLDTVTGGFKLTASEDWLVEKVQARFEAALTSGTATAEDVAYIVERMKNCPVSRNLTHTVKDTTLKFV